MHIDVTAIGLWVMIGAITVASIYFRHRQSESRDRLLQAFVEKGQPIPPELLQPPRRRDSLYSGIVLMFIGVALAIFLYVQVGANDPDAVSQGLIGIFPFAVGLALLIHALIERKRLKRSDD